MDKERAQATGGEDASSGAKSLASFISSKNLSHTLVENKMAADLSFKNTKYWKIYWNTVYIAEQIFRNTVKIYFTEYTEGTYI